MSGETGRPRPKLSELHQKAVRKRAQDGDGRARRQRVKKPRRAELAGLVENWLAPSLVLDGEGFVVFANETALSELKMAGRELVGYQFEVPKDWQRHAIEWRDEPAELWLKKTAPADQRGKAAQLEARCHQLEQQAERASKASDRLIEKMERMVERAGSESDALKKQLAKALGQSAAAKDKFLQAQRQAEAATRDLDEVKRQLGAERAFRTRTEEELSKLKVTSANWKNRIDDAEGRTNEAKRSADQAKAMAQASETKLRLAKERIAELEALVQKHIPNQEDALLSMLKSKRNRGY